MICNSNQHSDDSNHWDVDKTANTDFNLCMLHMFDEQHYGGCFSQSFRSAISNPEMPRPNDAVNPSTSYPQNEKEHTSTMNNYISSTSGSDSDDADEGSTAEESASSQVMVSSNEEIEQYFAEMIQSQTDPVGKYLRYRGVSAAQVVEFNLHRLLLQAPKTPRQKYGPRSDLTEEERVTLNKERNREHAWATRQRKKIFDLVDKELQCLPGIISSSNDINNSSMVV
eukprot:CAMPEP_0174982664 /NCGR_PEP_ID=MMETSP0004_2-20121128/16647_1 /TAXON_ID=420556 /ORGANISM="Ochromonas sp., Strain CCMP1393" /LENGTH=225 /DNA_ID=CAMNT_0016234697 /DNA_START=267 /DNA_END=944 /DNA_ORIENTATION=-